MAIATLGACSSSASQVPLVAQRGVPQQARQHSKKAHDLIYVSESGDNRLSILSYPNYQRVGAITGLKDPVGLCADASSDIWVVNQKSTKVQKFARGGKKPVATLNDSAAALPLACAVDPATGNLAVTDMNGESNIGGVLIYANAQGTPKVYSDSGLVIAYFCAYDANGNLFVDGLDKNYAFVLFELPAGGTNFEQITVSGTIDFPGGVAWDGQYLAVADQAYQGGRTSAIDDLSISGSTATIAATVPLNKSCDVMQFALVGGSSIAAPDACRDNVSDYAYPGGGDPIKQVDNLQFPVAAAVSIAP